ncbi:amino acid adenylation domain-containing protein [Ascidiimonas sp. W6]|uniref:non-ribosomal peptide synthetase n=1 Tax=Ascidiimonas meishanensis TaxID=3128903 RepID=UPI0030EC8027
MDIKKSNVKDIVELNMVQKGMLFNSLKEGNNSLYNIQVCIDISGSLHLDTIAAAIKQVQKDNDVLRSVFEWEKTSKPLQIILKETAFNFKTYILSELSENTIEEYIEKDKQKSFDLTNETPVRITLVSTGEDIQTLIITHHHILYDGWSTGIILKELFTNYYNLNKEHFLQGQIKTNYKNIVAAINKGYDKARAYENWEAYLQGYEIKELNTSVLNKAHHNFREIKQYSRSFSLENITAFSQRHKVTKAAIMYAAYGILLQKYLNTDDIVFGTPVSNRNPLLTGADEVVGNFINTLPVRCQHNSGDSVLEVIKNVNIRLKEQSDLSQSAVSYGEIKKIMGLRPDQVLFDSILAIENYPLDLKAINQNEEFKIELRSSYEHIETPLMLQVFFEEHITVSYLYHTNYFSNEFIERFALHFNTILNEIVQTPEKSVENIQYLTPSEEAQLIHEFNKTELNLAKDSTVLEAFDYWVNTTPEAIAINFQDEEITYGALHKKVNSFAKLLTANGVKSEDIIPVCLYPSIDMLVGLLAVMKSGGAYVPVDPEYPEDRISFIIKDTKAKAILTHSSLYKNFNEKYTGHIINLDGDYENDNTFFHKKVLANQRAYVIYTSGTTGTPKGVVISHAALYNFMKSMEDIIGVTKKVRFLGVTSFTFDISILEFFLPLTLGGQLVLANNEQSKNPELLKQYIAETNPTHIQTTPSRWQMLLDVGFRNDGEACILSGGEALTKKLKSELIQRAPNGLLNMYGPTETTIWSCVKLITADEAVTIGKPIGNTQIHITDTDMNLVPVGITGELCISGDGVAMGYLNRAELTNTKFLDNPFIKGKRLYKTGDMARWLPNGEIECLGRKDNQVKIRGYRIELEEIDSQLEKIEGINQAVTLVKESASGIKQLISYLHMPHKPNIKKIMEKLREKLPGYMIPKLFVEVDEYPLTVSGKIDRKKLLEKSVNISVSHNDAPPKTELEKKLAGIIQELLGLEKVGVLDGFFELGGDSITMMSFILRIKKEFQVTIPFNTFFQYQNIDALAKMIKISTSMSDEIEHEEGETIFI